MIVGKPSGLVVHRSEMGNERIAALQLVRDQLGRRVHPVHRLDRGTSGCLLFALRPELIGPLSEALRAGRKRYVALVRGHIASREPVTVDNPIKGSGGRLQEARTVLQAIASSREPRCSLVLAEPVTGRFHQIRRHIRDLSHPVLGDSTHGDTRENRRWREEYGLRRLALHCFSLEIEVPEGVARAVCPIPPDLGQVLERMPWWEEAQAALPELQVAESA